MSSKHCSMVWGSLVTLSIILLLTTLAVQVSASHPAQSDGNTLDIRLPPTGSVYAINLVGAAHISGEEIFKRVSAEMDFKVVSVKSTGIPSVKLELTSGKFSLGDDVYVLSKGTATIQSNKVNIEVSTKDGIKILTVFATLGGPLPISTSEGPVGLAPALHDKSANIQVVVEDWILDFNGNISRESTVITEKAPKPESFAEKISLSNTQFVDQLGTRISDISVGKQVVLQSSVKNNLSIDQKFAYIMQIKDSDGITIMIAWINGEIPRDKTFNIGLSWIPDITGKYAIDVFVWESVANPLPLSEMLRTTIIVT
ncbi:MAG: hypothetical protein ACE5J2_04925 [Nitrososphaerales archaeon]